MTNRARILRKQAALPERWLWSKLRRGQIGGMKFRRQHVIGPCIVDFFCAAKSVVIEIDGRSHRNRTTEDAQRSMYLNEQGYHVIRYTNDDVLRKLDLVVRDIAKQFGANK